MHITFEQAYNQYLKYIENRLKEQSIRSLKDKFKNHILPYFRDKNIYEIKEVDYIDFQNYVESEGYSYNTMKNIHFILSGFFNYLVSFYNLPNNIIKKVGCFKFKNRKCKEHDFYTLKEFKSFIKCVDEYVYKQFFNLMFYTGTRPGEAMALKFSDLSYRMININKTIDEHGSRTIGTPKTQSSYRNIFIDKKLYKDLLKLKKCYQEEYKNNDYDYFIFGGMKPLSPTSINRRKEKACNLANIRKIKLHEFRHSHATLLLNKGIVIHDISKRLGHSDVSTTLNIYTHSIDKQQKRVTRTLNLLRLF